MAGVAWYIAAADTTNEQYKREREGGKGKKEGERGKKEGERRGQVASQAMLPAAELLCVALPSHT